jgi:excisionase family DNA binding protein
MPKTATKKPALSELQQRFVSVQEAAEMLRISQVSIRRYLGQGKLKRFKVGSRTLLRHDEVMGLIRESDVA